MFGYWVLHDISYLVFHVQAFNPRLFNSRWLKSLGLKIPGLKLLVENSELKILGMKCHTLLHLGTFKPFLSSSYNPGLINRRWLKNPGLKSSRLSLGLESPGLKLGVENSGVEQLSIWYFTLGHLKPVFFTPSFNSGLFHSW